MSDRSGPAIKITTATVGLLCLVLSTISCGENNAASVPRVLAEVNGVPITEAQLIERLRHGPGPRMLLAMMDRRLIAAEAARRNIRPGAEHVELKLSQVVSRFGSERELAAMLRRQGTSMAELKDRLRVDAMLDEIATQQITVAAAEIEQYYQEHQADFCHDEQVRARLILAETRENAEAIKLALDSGGDFAGLARQLSIDPGSAEQGGDTGYFEHGDYAEEITEVAFALPVGKISDVFAVPDGYCILKVEERRPAGIEPLEQVREQIVSRLKHQRRPAARQEWLVEQRKRARLLIPDRRLREVVEAILETAAPPNPSEF